MSSIHSKLRHETSSHANEVEKLKSVINRLKEDLAHTKRDFEIARESAVVEYRESEAFLDDVANGCAKAFEIVFASLIIMLARDHPALNLSSYTLEKVLRASIFKDVGSCPPTLGTLVTQSQDALSIILEN